MYFIMESFLTYSLFSTRLHKGFGSFHLLHALLVELTIAGLRPASCSRSRFRFVVVPIDFYEKLVCLDITDRTSVQYTTWRCDT